MKKYNFNRGMDTDCVPDKITDNKYRVMDNARVVEELTLDFCGSTPERNVFITVKNNSVSIKMGIVEIILPSQIAKSMSEFIINSKIS